MRLLLDANLSLALAEPLTAAGYDVAHVVDVGLLRANDEAIFEQAVEEGYVVVIADSDFPMMLAVRETYLGHAVLPGYVVRLSGR